VNFGNMEFAKGKGWSVNDTLDAYDRHFLMLVHQSSE